MQIVPVDLLYFNKYRRILVQINKPAVGLRGISMARIINEEEYALRRNEILDAAQMFAYTKGYEQMTIQDILDQLKISKGAFYHYFDSKEALLEAMVDRMTLVVKDLLVPIVDDPTLPALDKLHRFFDTSARWKTQRKAVFISLVRVWYHDNNAIMRQKVAVTGLKWVIPQLTKIIQQGIREGVFSTPYPDQAGNILMGLIEHLGDYTALLMLAALEDPGGRQRLDAMVAAYTDAMERVLGLASGKLHPIDPKVLDEWFTQPEPAEAEAPAAEELQAAMEQPAAVETPSEQD